MKDESDCPCNLPVFWRGKLYVTGNRRHEEAELYTVRGRDFVRCVKISELVPAVAPAQQATNSASAQCPDSDWCKGDCTKCSDV